MLTTQSSTTVKMTKADSDLINLLLNIIKSAETSQITSIHRCTQISRQNVPYKKSPLSLDSDQMPNIKSSKPEFEPDKAKEQDYSDEEVGKYRKYKKNNEIAQQCQKLLRITAYPTVAQLTQLVDQISQSNSTNNMEISEIRSAVLQWFRKRREYMACKVYSVCDDVMADAWIGTINKALEADQPSPTYEQAVELILNDDILIETVQFRAKLPVKNFDNLRNFVQRKVRDYFTKLCTKTSSE